MVDIGSINSSIITLILKKPAFETLNDFRPISLLDSHLKLLTKLLADTLQGRILELVHRNQYGFGITCTIQDCLIWSFVYLHQCKNSGKESKILKLDFKKAFDLVEREAILQIVEIKGFDARWINCIIMLFCSASSDALLNGVIRKSFKCKRGVR